MKRKKIKTEWLLPCGTGAMSVEMYRCPNSCHLVRVEADMHAATSGVELTVPACEELLEFAESYHHLNGSRDELRDMDFGVLPSEGLYLDVLPEHAEEIAARIAVFVTDPVNHTVLPRVYASRIVLGRDLNLLTAKCMTWTEKHARPAVEAARKKIEAAYPEFIVDPLGTIPGNQRNVSV